MPDGLDGWIELETLRNCADLRTPGLHYVPQQHGEKGGTMKTDIDPDFPITEKMREWAAAKTPRVDIDLETEKFIDYWRGHGKRMACWESTWRNWMRRAPDMGGCLKVRTSADRKPAVITDEQRKKDHEAWLADMRRLNVAVLK